MISSHPFPFSTGIASPALKNFSRLKILYLLRLDDCMVWIDPQRIPIDPQPDHRILTRPAGQ